MYQLKIDEKLYPKFDGHDRVREYAIKIQKNRPSSMKGFCYKNQDKNIRNTIFPQKWQWRINERRNVLQEHEFLNERHKRTQKMEDLKSQWPPKFQVHSQTLIKGYKKKITEQ